MQSVAVAHDMTLRSQPRALRQARRAPVEIGIDWRVQLLPFHSSLTGRVGVDPTATHAADDVHETLFNSPPPIGFGSDCSDQRDPSQRSANGICTPDAV
jgi:hypothetical protein